MGVFDSYRQTLTDTIFATYGKAADWISGGSTPVTVRLMTPDQPQPFGHTRALLPTALVKVRSAEVAAPAEGDQVQTYADDDRTVPDQLFRIIAEPEMLDPHGREWTCEAVLV
jgi:hypothetical protein